MNALEDALDIFPKRTVEQSYASFIFQPERVSINSRMSNQTNSSELIYENQNFTRFSNQLVSPILHAKSIELYRVTGSLPIPSIPNDQTVFYYYKIPIIGGGNLTPDYSQLTAANIKIVRLLTTVVYSPSRYLPAVSASYGFNGIFNDYDELVAALNRAATADPNAATLNAYYTAGDISFSYDETTKKIIFQGNNYLSGGVPAFYYIPVGYDDTNLLTVQAALINLLGNRIFQFQRGYTLNKRLGFLWDGNGPFTAPVYGGAIDYVFPIPNAGYLLPPYTPINRYFADSYADLLHTHNIFIYCDIVGGSTQDTNIKDNLLAVVPVNAGQLGILTYQSSQSCKLTKISTNIYEITIIMKTDTGADFWIPINGFVNIEFALTY
jgi:hypothetical protein